MNYELHVLGLEVDDPEDARGVANSIYVQLEDAGHDVEGVAVVRTDGEDEER